MKNKTTFSEKNITSALQERQAFAEVIESSLDGYLAQSWEWNFFPRFGSLVQVEDDNQLVLGVVVQIQTGSMDPMRYPFPFQKTEKELRAEQPQIFEFLKTTFRVQVLGYHNEITKKVYYQLAQKPCRIHAFVQECNPELFEQFFNNTLFLNLLFAFQNNITNLDELLLAILVQLHEMGLLNQDKVHAFCQQFSLLSGNDYRRLKLFLKRVEQIVW
jgi:hypothetical protein